MRWSNRIHLKERSARKRKPVVLYHPCLNSIRFRFNAARKQTAEPPSPTILSSNTRVTPTYSSFVANNTPHLITPPPTPPQGNNSNNFNSNVLSLRLKRQGARQSEKLQASLIWNDIADLDLSCITPDKERIYYGRKEADCGGWLDVDMNVNAHNASKEAVENIFWASAPSGRYEFRVINYQCHTVEKSGFTDPNRVVPFRLFITQNGKVDEYNGTLKNKDTVNYNIDVAGDGALGRFVVMSPSNEKTTFKKMCESNGVTYTQGEGYYAVARNETISMNKYLILQNIDNDTFTLGTSACRELLGWPADGNLIKGLCDIPLGFRLFVQSTSHNRVIPSDTHAVMKVSVEEALRHRPAHDTQFLNDSHTIGKA